MSYEIGFSPKGRTVVSKAYQPNALSALETVRTLEAHNEQIAYISGPEGEAIRLSDLNMLAEREVSGLGRDTR